jgi:hypothetical protein
MSRRAWIIFFLTMLLFTISYVGWWVRCALVPARPVCQSYHAFANIYGFDVLDYRIISGEFTKDAFEHYIYFLVEEKVPHAKIDEKIYIPLWFFLSRPGMLSLITGLTTLDIGRSNGIIYDTVKDESCAEDFDSGGIEPNTHNYKDYPPAWLRNFMLSLALFNSRQERLKSCDWLCGESRKWQVRQFTLNEERKHRRIWLDWSKEIRAYYDGQQKDHPGLFLDYLKTKLGGRDPY